MANCLRPRATRPNAAPVASSSSSRAEEYGVGVRESRRRRTRVAMIVAVVVAVAAAVCALLGAPLAAATVAVSPCACSGLSLLLQLEAWDSIRARFLEIFGRVFAHRKLCLVCHLVVSVWPISRPPVVLFSGCHRLGRDSGRWTWLLPNPLSELYDLAAHRPILHLWPMFEKCNVECACAFATPRASS